MLICEATQTGKCWDDIKGILRFKLCNANIHTYTSHFMEIQQKDNETLAAYTHLFKTAAKQCAFDNNTAPICIFVKGVQEAPTITPKICKTLNFSWSHETCWETECSTPANSHTNTFHSQYDVQWW